MITLDIWPECSFRYSSRTRSGYCSHECMSILEAETAPLHSRARPYSYMTQPMPSQSCFRRPIQFGVSSRNLVQCIIESSLQPRSRHGGLDGESCPWSPVERTRRLPTWCTLHVQRERAILSTLETIGRTVRASCEWASIAMFPRLSWLEKAMRSASADGVIIPPSASANWIS